MRTDPSRFDRVEQHPEFRSAPAQPVLPADGGVGVAAVAAPLVFSLFGGLFLLVAITLLLSFGAPLIVSVMFVAVSLVFVFGGIAMSRGLVALRDAPVARMIAVIVKERTEVSGDSNSSSTTYYTTLQTRDGQRSEFRTAGSLAGRLVVDDIGVAYVRSYVLDFRITRIHVRSLVEFIRFDVD